MIIGCKHKFVFKANETFYRESGRYHNTYTSIDYFFCEKCLELKEVRKQETVSIYETDKIPDWARVITKKANF